MTSEDNQYHWDCHNPKKRPYAHFMNLEPIPRAFDGKAGLRPDVKSTGWYNMVQAFSNRRLTCSSDVLPAVSGLAPEVHELTGSKYLAGLWKESLDTFTRNLVWTTYHRPYMAGLKGSAPPRPSFNGSPSWSWASITGSIEFDKIDSDFYCLHQPNLDPRFLLMQTNSLTENKYGQVDGGRIAVVGTCHVYMGPLSFITVTARVKADLVRKEEEKFRRKKEKRLRRNGNIKEQNEINRESYFRNTSDGQGKAKDAMISGSTDDTANEDKDSDYNDDSIYLASMEWDTLDDGFDYEAFDAAHAEKAYGNHRLTMDIGDDSPYEWTSREHLILFMGLWDVLPIKDGLKEGEGEQWFLVLRRVEDQNTLWEEPQPGLRTVYEEPSWQSEFKGKEQGNIPYYERVGFAQTDMDYQLPITEEEGWTRKSFYFV